MTDKEAIKQAIALPAIEAAKAVVLATEKAEDKVSIPRKMDQ